MSMLRIIGGAIHDPANGIDGEIRDLCIRDGKIVAELPSDAPTYNATGRIIMAGGVDVHSHVASASCNHGRRLLPEEHAAEPMPAPVFADGSRGRSGTGGTLPSTFTTGYRYAGLGYTTVMDAAVAPLLARHSHHEFDDTPCIDGGFFTLMGNDEFLLRQIDAGEPEKARDYMAWLLGATGAYAVKIVNPGGIEAWKTRQRNLHDIDEALAGRGSTPRKILSALADAANGLTLPHGIHVHCNNLGIPGNVATTLASMQSLDGRRAHFTHLQFHCYGGGEGKPWSSAAREVIGWINAHPEHTVDVGQVMFGPATTVTADGPVEYLLWKSSGRKWTNVDIELESGCGIIPYMYKDTAAVAALQWAVGLELFLLSQDPWRVVLSTDHPNGGSFASYPKLIQLLMDKSVRDAQLARCNQSLLAGSALLDGIDREYTLNEIAIITRAGPARVLGLAHKGHLGVGADADVTIYDRQTDIAAMFTTPHCVLKGGEIIVEEGHLRLAPRGARLHVKPGHDAAVIPAVRRHFDEFATVQFDNFAVSGLPTPPVVPA